MTTVVVPSSIKIEVRKRLSRGSVDWHVLHSHAMTGTPCEVPVPRKVILSTDWFQKIGVVSDACFELSYRSLSGNGSVEFSGLAFEVDCT